MKLRNLKLIILFGKPGSGKTFLSKRLAMVTNFVRVSTDETRHKLFPEASFSDFETYSLWEILNTRTKSLLLHNHGVIIDGNVGKVCYREKIVNCVLPGDIKPYIAIFVDCNDKIAMERIKHRSLSDNTFGCDIQIFRKISQEIEFSRNENILIFSNESNNNSDFEAALFRLIYDLEAIDVK